MVQQQVRHVPRGNTSLSKHGDPVFPHFYPLNQNLAHIRTCPPPPFVSVRKPGLV